MPMQETIPPYQKRFQSRYGDANIFGPDSARRRRMDDDLAIESFDRVWQSTLADQVENAEKITIESAREMLDEKSRPYAQAGFEFRQFSLHNVPFIARVKDGVCSQLWSLGMHRDNARLSIHFHSVEECGRFKELAGELGWDPRDLALSLVMDFMHKVDHSKFMDG